MRRLWPAAKGRSRGTRPKRQPGERGRLRSHLARGAPHAHAATSRGLTAYHL